MNFKLKILSYTLAGSGESEVLIDNDLVFDNLGIPYIPGRRIKGLLKESALEVLEMLGIDDSSLIDSLFGASGFIKGKLKIPNFYISNYLIISKSIKSLIDKNKGYQILLSNSHLIKYFTEIRQQTAIDEKGIAKEHSLRTYRVLKPGIFFESKVEDKDFSEREKALFYISALNLRRIGTRRNRGFGKVKCKTDYQMDVNNAIKVLKSEEKTTGYVLTQTNLNFEGLTNSISADRITYLPFKIKTISPIVMAVQKGDQNTISTFNYIPSTTIRGILANKIIEKLKLLTLAHDNDLFYEIILSGVIEIKPAYPFKQKIVFYPSPLNLHQIKGENEQRLYNVFETEKLDNKKTIPVDGFVSLQGDYAYRYSPDTLINFHHARSRLEGRSTGESIFYYEAIAPNEEFYGEIYGPEIFLSKLRELLGGEFKTEIGRSKTAQYGGVFFKFLENEEIGQYKNYSNEFTLTAISPIILYNDYGSSEITVEKLIKYLKEYFASEVEIEKVAAKLGFVESFLGIWRSKTPRDLAFGEGSTFKIRLSNLNKNTCQQKINELELYGIGERTEQGFGQVKVDLISKQEYPTKSTITKEEQEKSTNDKIKPILESILHIKVLEIAEREGINEALRSTSKVIKNLTTHLVCKVEEIIISSNNFNEIKQKLIDMEKKDSGKNLKKYGLFNRLLGFEDVSNLVEKDLKIIGLSEIDFDLSFKDSRLEIELYKAYWKKLLRNLRILLKVQKESHK